MKTLLAFSAIILSTLIVACTSSPPANESVEPPSGATQPPAAAPGNVTSTAETATPTAVPIASTRPEANLARTAAPAATVVQVPLATPFTSTVTPVPQDPTATPESGGEFMDVERATYRSGGGATTGKLAATGDENGTKNVFIDFRGRPGVIQISEGDTINTVQNLDTNDSIFTFIRNGGEFNVRANGPLFLQTIQTGAPSTYIAVNADAEQAYRDGLASGRDPFGGAETVHLSEANPLEWEIIAP